VPASALTVAASQLVAYAGINRLAVVKILKKHRKLVGATEKPDLIRTSTLTEVSILETVRTDRSFWSGTEAEALEAEMRKLRWDSSRLRARVANTAVP
jgi:hypothetical protein